MVILTLGVISSWSKILEMYKENLISSVSRCFAIQNAKTLPFKMPVIQVFT